MATINLDPVTPDVSNAWTISTGSTVWGVLDDAVRDPTAPGSDNINTGTATAVSNVNVAGYTLGTGGTGEYVTTAVVHYYAVTGLKRGITVELLDNNNNVLASDTIGASQSAAWHSFTYTGTLTQAQITDLKIRMTCNQTAGGGGAGTVQIQAAYVVLNTYVPVEYTDSATIGTVTTPSGTEIKTHDYTESATVGIVTAVQETTYENIFVDNKETTTAVEAVYNIRVNTVSFTPGIDIRLDFVKLVLCKDSRGDPGTCNIYIVEDNAGDPTGTQVASYSFDGAVLPAYPAKTSYKASFSSPPILNAGVTYWVVLQASNAIATTAVGWFRSTGSAVNKVNTDYPSGSWSVGTSLSFQCGNNLPVEIHELIDSATIETITTPSGTDEYTAGSSGTEYIESATVDTLTSISAIELVDTVDSATVDTILTPSTAEISDFVDSTTINPVVSLTSEELTDYIDAQTVSTTTTVTSEEIALVSKQTEIYRVQLSVGNPPNDPSPQTIIVECKKANPTDSGILCVWLYANDILIEGPYDITLTDAMTVYEHDVINYADIDDWSDIEIAIQGFSDSGFELTPQVSRIEYDIPPAGAVAYFESATITTTTTPSAIEISDFVDADTVATASSLESAELREIPDAAIVDTTTTPSTTDVAAFIESSTITTTTVVETTELHELFDAATVNTTTSPSSIDVAEFVDSAIIDTTTTLSAIELYEQGDAATIETITTPTSSDVAAYLDQETISGLTTVSSVDELVGTGLDEATISTSTTVIPSDIADFIDSDTATSTTSVSFIEVTDYTDSTTITTITTPASTDVADYVDLQTISTTTEVTWEEIYGNGIFEVATFHTITSLTYEEIAAFVDSATVSTLTTVITSELHELYDAATLTSTTTVSSVEIAAFVDSSIISTITTVESTELRIQTDTATVSTTTVPLSSDIAAFVDAATNNTTTSVISLDVIEHIDAATIGTITTPSAVEIAAYVDSSIIPTTTSPTTDDVAAFIDSATISTVTTITSFEGQTNVFLDSSTVSYGVTITSSDILAAIDSTTISNRYDISATESVDYIDSNTITTRSTPSTVDLADLASYLDASEIDTNTTVAATEFTAHDYLDSDMVAFATGITYTDIASYIDSALLHTGTNVGYTETADYLDTATIGNVTFIYTQEETTFVYEDGSIVTTITTVSGVEYYKITIINLTGEIFFRWRARFDTHWDSKIDTLRIKQMGLRWDADMFGQRWRSK